MALVLGPFRGLSFSERIGGSGPRGLWPSGLRCHPPVDAAGRWPLDQQVENLLYGRGGGRLLGGT